MSLNTYLKNIDNWSELEESLARYSVLNTCNTIAWEQDSYKDSYDWNEIP
jgi:hypothetical protein